MTDAYFKLRKVLITETLFILKCAVCGAERRAEGIAAKMVNDAAEEGWGTLAGAALCPKCAKGKPPKK
jgi:hypothetical protein